MKFQKVKWYNRSGILFEIILMRSPQWILWVGLFDWELKIGGEG